ncbi:LysR family transcriptional regulator [Pseudomonas aeruginosa]
MVRIFCTAAEAGSFREAATRLGISPQGVTRAIQALETELGESLFHCFRSGLRQRCQVSSGSFRYAIPVAQDGA